MAVIRVSKTCMLSAHSAFFNVENDFIFQLICITKKNQYHKSKQGKLWNVEY